MLSTDQMHTAYRLPIQVGRQLNIEYVWSFDSRELDFNWTTVGRKPFSPCVHQLSSVPVHRYVAINNK